MCNKDIGAVSSFTHDNLMQECEKEDEWIWASGWNSLGSIVRAHVSASAWEALENSDHHVIET